jgi:hypothetical protein
VNSHWLSRFDRERSGGPVISITHACDCAHSSPQPRQTGGWDKSEDPIRPCFPLF